MWFITLFMLLFIGLIDGQCLNDCSGHGQCQTINQPINQTNSGLISSSSQLNNGSSYSCVCQPGWLAIDCSVESLMAPLCNPDNSHCMYWRIANQTMYHRTIAVTQKSITTNDQPDYQLNSQSNNHSVDESVSDPIVFAPNAGWAAVMFIPINQSTDDPMANGRIIKMTVSNGLIPKVIEMFAPDSDFPNQTLNQTISQSNITGYSTATTLDVSWQRSTSINQSIDLSQHFEFPTEPGTLTVLGIARHSVDFDPHGDDEALLINQSIDLYESQLPVQPVNPTNNQSVCVNSCSKHGRCVNANNQTVDPSFYSSIDQSVYQFNNQSNNQSVSCLCDAGYLGVDCSVKASSEPICFGSNKQSTNQPINPAVQRLIQASNDQLCLSWAFSFDTGLFHARMILTETLDQSKKPSQWLAIMFNSTDGMTNGTGTRFSIDQSTNPLNNQSNNQVEPFDFVSSGKRPPKQSDNQSINQSLTTGHSLSQTLNQSILHTLDISFSRPVVSTDDQHFNLSFYQSNDQSINRSVLVSLAWGDSIPWTRHTGKGKQFIDLLPLVDCSLDCSNHGKCVVQSNNQVCLCDPGHIGYDCAIKADSTIEITSNIWFDWSVIDGLLIGRLRTIDQSVEQLFSQSINQSVSQLLNWIGLMFRSTDGMTNGWAFVFSFDQVQSNNQYASEWWSAGTFRPSDQLTSYITNVVPINQAINQQWVSDIQFSRPCVPNNQTNNQTNVDPVSPLVLPTKAGESILVSWAFGTTDQSSKQSIKQSIRKSTRQSVDAFTWNFHKDNKGKFFVDLLTGNNQSINQSLFQTYLPFIIWLGFVLVAGAIVRLIDTLIGHCTQRRLPSLFYRSKAYEQSINQSNDQSDNQLIHVALDKPSINRSILRFLDQVTLNVVSTIWSWTFDQLIVFALYIAALVYYINHAINQSIYQSIHVSFGHLTAIHFILIMLPVKRRSPLLRLIGISFERALVYHRCCARITLILCLTHGLLVINQSVNQSIADVIFSKEATLHGEGALYGTISFFSLVMLTVLSNQVVRQNWFELFYYCHVPVAMTCLAMAMVHSVYVRYYMIAPLAAYGLDRFLRKVWTQGFEQVDVRIIGEKPHRIVEISVNQSNNRSIRRAEPGQYAFMRVSDISLLQWHPFSINQSNNQFLQIHVLENKAGSFTNQLIEHIDQQINQPTNQPVKQPKRSNDQSVALLQDSRSDDYDGHSQNIIQTNNQTNKQSISQTVKLSIDIDGPYGNLSVNLSKAHYRTLILVAGGVGVTPMASILSHFLANEQTNKQSITQSINPSITRVVFVWTARSEPVLLDTFPQLIDQSINDKRVQLLLFNTNHSSNNQSDNQSTPFIHSGRPDLHAIFAQTAQEHHRSNNQSINQSHVAVLACGPIPLIESAQSTANEFGYHFHKEVFQF